MQGRRFLLSAADGFLGRALVQRLRRDGAHLTVVSPDPARTRSRLGAEVEVVPPDALPRAAEGVEAVVHLEGADDALGGPRDAPTPGGAALEGALAAVWRSRHPPPVLMTLDGDAATGALQAAARAAGARGVALAPGLVLGAGGGLLRPFLAAAERGVALRPLGDAPLPWVHLHDLLEAMVRGLADPGWRGEVPLVAPGVARVDALGPAVAAALGARAQVPLPGAVLRRFAGRGADRLRGPTPAPGAPAPGFTFRYPTLPLALAQVTDPARLPALLPAPGRRAPDGRPARWRLRQSTWIPAPPEAVFSFFSNAENLGLLTPGWMDFRILDHDRPLGAGARIRYRLRLGPLPVGWLTRIASWAPPTGFVDDQVRGPYRLWWHEHRFFPEAGGTRMEDEVLYALPLGPAGGLAHRPAVAPALRAIFGYRAEAIALRFGPGRPAGGRAGREA